MNRVTLWRSTRVRRPLLVLGFLLLSLETAYAATQTFTFDINSASSSITPPPLFCFLPCPEQPPIGPISGTFSMTLDDSKFDNMRLHSIVVTTPLLPFGPFDFPEYKARLTGPDFLGDENDCHWPLDSFCISEGNFGTFAGTFNGNTLSLTGLDPIDFIRSYAYTINAVLKADPVAAPPVPGPHSLQLIFSGLLLLMSVIYTRRHGKNRTKLNS
jgi:hypothetical protein